MSLKTPTILIVDDEPFNLEIIKDFLDGQGYDLYTADDGLMALEMLEADPEKFDLILLDRMMPRMDGMELLAKLKVHPTLVQLPVILQTAMASKNDITEGMKAGAYYYLTKPFESDMLRSVVATAVDDSHRYRQMQEQIAQTMKINALMKSAEFTFKDLEQARGLATLFSNICPNPQRVVVGMSELLINAVEHGNLGITYDEKGELKEAGNWLEEVEKRLQHPDYADLEVNVKMEKQNDKIVFLITDQGEGFDFNNYLEMDAERAFDNHGRGIAMSRMLSFDHLEYLGKGNQVRVEVMLDS